MLWSALILGFLGSWHCIGMCGPIALMIPGAKGKSRLLALLLYHGGKILSYALIGSLFGLFTAFVDSFQVQAIITISVGVVIGIIAFIPALLNWTEKKGFGLFSGLVQFKNRLAKALKKERIEYGFYIGFLNGFIPCGLVYIAALGAMTQPTFPQSVLYMVLFGIGIMPFMSALILTSSFLKKKYGRYAPRIRFAAFLLVSSFMIYRGYINLNKEFEQPKIGDQFEVCH